MKQGALLQFVHIYPDRIHRKKYMLLLLQNKPQYALIAEIHVHQCSLNYMATGQLVKAGDSQGFRMAKLIMEITPA